METLVSVFNFNVMSKRYNYFYVEITIIHHTNVLLNIFRLGLSGEGLRFFNIPQFS